MPDQKTSAETSKDPVESYKRQVEYLRDEKIPDLEKEIEFYKVKESFFFLFTTEIIDRLSNRQNRRKDFEEIQKELFKEKF